MPFVDEPDARRFDEDASVLGTEVAEPEPERGGVFGIALGANRHNLTRITRALSKFAHLTSMRASAAPMLSDVNAAEQETPKLAHL